MDIAHTMDASKCFFVLSQCRRILDTTSDGDTQEIEQTEKACQSFEAYLDEMHDQLIKGPFISLIKSLFDRVFVNAPIKFWQVVLKELYVIHRLKHSNDKLVRDGDGQNENDEE